MRFTKMQGAGNDYLYVNGFEEAVPDPERLAVRIADRHFGAGGDGLIIIRPPVTAGADCRMEMYNADGSRGRMCGNGIRCVAKYVHDRGLARKPEIRIDTDAGLKTVRVVSAHRGKAETLEVDMGTPAFARAAIPLTDGGDPRAPAIGLPIEVLDRSFRLTAVSMGNPHAVVRVDEPGPDGERYPEIADLPLRDWGPAFERHPWFPERVNTEFIAVRSRRALDFRVWERGSGETLACGTGACAAAVAAMVHGWCEPEVTVQLRGGDLTIRWEGAGDPGGGPHDARPVGRVLMTGPAVEVFTGDWPG
jgi:diaminopimelate epimerase